MESVKLIQSQIEQTKEIIGQVEKLKTVDSQTLRRKENPISWSILECLEHLNLYGNFYLPQIENSIRNSKTKSEIEFKTRVLGNYFAKSMLPKDKLNKMKTFKNKNPIYTNIGENVIDNFLNQQIKLIDLLNQSKKISLSKVKIKTSVSSLIQLKLGDTFQFIINHNIRHLKQINQLILTNKDLNNK